MKRDPEDVHTLHERWRTLSDRGDAIEGAKGLAIAGLTSEIVRTPEAIWGGGRRPRLTLGLRLELFVHAARCRSDSSELRAPGKPHPLFVKPAIQAGKDSVVGHCTGRLPCPTNANGRADVHHRPPASLATEVRSRHRSTATSPRNPNPSGGCSTGRHEQECREVRDYPSSHTTLSNGSSPHPFCVTTRSSPRNGVRSRLSSRTELGGDSLHFRTQIGWDTACRVACANRQRKGSYDQTSSAASGPGPTAPTPRGAARTRDRRGGSLPARSSSSADPRRSLRSRGCAGTERPDASTPRVEADPGSLH